MSIGSGLAASVGIAAEGAYGTYTAPTRFFPFTKHDLKKVKNTVQGMGLQAGLMVPESDLRVVSTVGGAGSLEMDTYNQGIGLLLSHLFGGGGAPTQQETTAAYLQAHTLADNRGKSLTVQAGVPGRDGTVHPYSYVGGKVLSAEFACKVNGLLTATYEFDFKDVVEDQVLGAPSYPTGLKPFRFGPMTVKLGAYGAEASVSGVKGWSLKIERPQDAEGFYAGSETDPGAPGTKAEPVMNDFVKITGKVDVDLITKADFADRFASDDAVSMVVEFTGANIESTYNETLRFTTPATHFDEGTPAVEGPGVTSTSFAFTGLFDATHGAVAADFISTDATL